MGTSHAFQSNQHLKNINKDNSIGSLQQPLNDFSLPDVNAVSVIHG
jgi:hypothetical protein